HVQPTARSVELDDVRLRRRVTRNHVVVPARAHTVASRLEITENRLVSARLANYLQAADLPAAGWIDAHGFFAHVDQEAFVVGSPGPFFSPYRADAWIARIGKVRNTRKPRLHRDPIAAIDWLPRLAGRQRRRSHGSKRGEEAKANHWAPPRDSRQAL